MSKKYKISMTKVSRNWRYVFYAGYCDLQDIMRGVYPNAYNAGNYGWNCDIYFDYSRDIAINTGYRNLRGKRIPSELIKEFSDIAKEICKHPFSTPWEETEKALNENRENFFDALMKI